MPFRPSLTNAELHDIGQRKDPADIIRLLWEIKRLRDLTLRMRGHLITESQTERNDLLRITSEEPVVRENSPKQVRGGAIEQ